jgi:hypothetical protein
MLGSSSSSCSPGVVEKEVGDCGNTGVDVEMLVRVLVLSPSGVLLLIYKLSSVPPKQTEQ